jgi:hypothetical protein
MKIREIVERAESRFKQAMRVDPTAYDFSKGNWEDSQDGNIMMQLIKNVDRKGDYPIRFKDGSEIKLNSIVSHDIVMKLGELLPKERHQLVKKLIQSPEQLKQFIHQYIKR